MKNFFTQNSLYKGLNKIIKLVGKMVEINNQHGYFLTQRLQNKTSYLW